MYDRGWIWLQSFKPLQIENNSKFLFLTPFLHKTFTRSKARYHIMYALTNYQEARNMGALGMIQLASQLMDANAAGQSIPPPNPAAWQHKPGEPHFNNIADGLKSIWEDCYAQHLKRQNK